MRIGINGLFQASGGSLKSLTQLFDQWRRSGVLALHEFVLFASQHTQERLRDVLPPEIKVCHMPLADRGLVGRLIAEQLQLSRAVAKEQVDVLFCPANTMPLWSKAPCVVTFQNAAPFSPEMDRCQIGWRERLRWRLLRKLAMISARRASKVIFISHYFRDLLVRETGLDAEKGVVIYRSRETAQRPSPADRKIETKHQVERPYLLMVSHLYPYKNIVELVEGFSIARSQGQLAGVQLVIAGGTLLAPEYHARIKATIARHGLSDRDVRLTGDVPPAEVKPLAANCIGFVFSSVCENCPTGLIEALSLGRAVACSNVGVMPEIAGDAAVYFDPFSPSEIAAALTRLVHEPQLAQQLSQRAVARSLQFPTEAEAARQSLRAIESAVARKALRAAA